MIILDVMNLSVYILYIQTNRVIIWISFLWSPLKQQVFFI